MSCPRWRAVAISNYAVAEGIRKGLLQILRDHFAGFYSEAACICEYIRWPRLVFGHADVDDDVGCFAKLPFVDFGARPASPTMC